MARERRGTSGTAVATKSNGRQLAAPPPGVVEEAALEQLEDEARVFADADGAGVPAPAPDFTSAIYDAVTAVFASKNPTQLFCLCWPGTVLDYDRLAWSPLDEVAGLMPEESLVRSSQILDQYVAAAPLTQPDGTRVSDRYADALAQFGPKPNRALIELQDIIRARLKVTITREVDGKPRTFTIAGWFDYLYGAWTDAKRVWADKQLEMREYFQKLHEDDPNRDAWWSDYLQWYGDNADAYIARINGKWQQLVAEFPLNEWQDAISILDTRDNAGLEEARQILNNAIRPLPYQEGVDYVPTQGVPYDWPLELKPVSKFLDLLADPDSQQMLYETAIAQLEQEVFNWTAIVPQIADEEVKQSAEAMSRATKDYGAAQSQLITTYGKNTVEAVKMYCDIMKSRGKTIGGTPQPEQQKITDDVNSTAKDLPGGQTSQVDWDQIKDIADKLMEGQTALIKDQQRLIDSGIELAEAAERFLGDKWNQSHYPWLQGYIAQLRNKLDAVKRQWDNFSSASNVWFKYRETAKGTDPNDSADFGRNAYPSPLDSPANDRWTAVTASIDISQLQATTTMSSSFSATQWGLDLFFGSAGGSYQSSQSHFGSDYMKAGSKIQIGFLATKVLIERPWMRPELFQHTKNFFRTSEKPMSPDWQVTAPELLGPGGDELIRDLIQNYAFPCYPAAFLLVKDVTVRVQIQVDKMQELRDYAKSVKSQGGGFFCFSVSATESSESQSESTNEYCMAGQFIAKAPAPQILGYWTQFMPPDESEVLTPELAALIAQSLGFVSKLQETHAAGELTAVTPTSA
jgi:hypothetical protein